MTTLTKRHREIIVHRLIEDTFKERHLRLKQQEHALGLQLLRAVYGDDVLTKCAEMPEGWLPQSNNIYLPISVGGYWCLEFNEYIRMPSSACRGLKDDLPKTWINQYEAHRELSKALKDEESQLEQQVKSVLSGFRTIEKLCEGWPEGYSYLPAEEIKANYGVPALRIEDLNQRIAAAKEMAIAA